MTRDTDKEVLWLVVALHTLTSSVPSHSSQVRTCSRNIVTAGKFTEATTAMVGGWSRSKTGTMGASSLLMTGTNSRVTALLCQSALSLRSLRAFCLREIYLILSITEGSVSTPHLSHVVLPPYIFFLHFFRKWAENGWLGI